MSAAMQVVYAVNVTFRGSDAIWMRFNSGWCAGINYDAEFVGSEQVVKWLDSQLGADNFVPAFNLAGNEEKISNFKKSYIDNLTKRGQPTYHANLPLEVASLGGLFHRVEEPPRLLADDKEVPGAGLYVTVRPVSICTYGDNSPIRISCHYADVKVVFTGDNIHEAYSNLSAGLGEHFAGALMALYEMANCPAKFNTKLGDAWEVHIETGSVGTTFDHQPDAVAHNPAIKGYEVDVQLADAYGAIRMINFTTDEQGQIDDCLISELENVYRYDKTAHLSAMARYQLSECPYYDELGLAPVIDTGEFSVAIRAVR